MVLGNLCFIMNTDAQLLKINQDYLDHDYFTDVITFDYTDKNIISGDIFVSLDRVEDNANVYKVDFETELRRVMAHGILHLLGYKDKTSEEKNNMTQKEDYYLKSIKEVC